MLTLLLASLLLCTSQIIVAGGPADYTVSGYVLDTNGNPIANATVTFVRGTPVYPHCQTNGSGYYELKPYSGENSVSIVPPEETNFLKYRQDVFDVDTNKTANFTLSSGYRLSGLVLDQYDQPIKRGAYQNVNIAIFLDSYNTQIWADSNGAYFVVAPAGTYTIHAKECDAIGAWGAHVYPREYELLSSSSVTLSSDTTADIIVNMLASTPTPTPENTPTATTELPITTHTPTGATSQPTPAIPELPSWTIILLGLLLIAVVCCFVLKRTKTESSGPR